MNPKATVYLETTIPSFLTARPSNDLIIRRLEQVIQDLGYRPPTICTPTELFGGQNHE